MGGIIFLIIINSVYLYIRPLSNEALLKKLQPSILLINTYDDIGNHLAQGTGFIINQDGEAVTCRHVLEGSYSADVVFMNGAKFKIKDIIAEDNKYDLVRFTIPLDPYSIIRSGAFDKENASRTILKKGKLKLKPVTVVDCLPEIGDQIFVVGHPMGLQQSLSNGIISAIQNIDGNDNVIQITAPISPGSSGSPVVDSKGNVIGVASFQIKGGQNLNFAIPSQKIATLKPLEPITLSKWGLGDAGIWLENGSEYENQKDYYNAIACYHRSIKEKPTFLAYMRIAYCYEELGQLDEVIKTLENALQYYPNNSEIYCALGAVYSLVNKSVLAISAFETATKLDPENKDAFWRLGISYRYLYYISSNHSYLLKAHEAFKEVVRIDSNDSIGRYSLGVLYVDIGDLKAALEEYEVLKELDGELARELHKRILSEK